MIHGNGTCTACGTRSARKTPRAPSPPPSSRTMHMSRLCPGARTARTPAAGVASSSNSSTTPAAKSGSSSPAGSSGVVRAAAGRIHRRRQPVAGAGKVGSSPAVPCRQFHRSGRSGGGEQDVGHVLRRVPRGPDPSGRRGPPVATANAPLGRREPLPEAGIDEHELPPALDEQAVGRHRDPVLLVAPLDPVPERLRHHAEHRAAVEREGGVGNEVEAQRPERDRRARSGADAQATVTCGQR